MRDRRGGCESLGAEAVSSNGGIDADRRNDGGFFKAWTKKYKERKKLFRCRDESSRGTGKLGT